MQLLKKYKQDPPPMTGRLGGNFYFCAEFRLLFKRIQSNQMRYEVWNVVAFRKKYIFFTLCAYITILYDSS